MSNKKLSKFCEGSNQMTCLKKMVECGSIQRGTEIFICTNNQVAELTYFERSSKFYKLHKMIISLRKLEMYGALIVHFLWILGKCVIEQKQTDYLRGKVASGKIQGNSFLKYLLFNKNVLFSDNRV